MNTHLSDRLKSRDINIPESVLYTLAQACKQDTALIIAHLQEHKGDSVSRYYKRTESNGDTIVMIVRNKRPVTIMFRRSSQHNDATQLRVNAIADIADYLTKYLH